MAPVSCETAGCEELNPKVPVLFDWQSCVWGCEVEDTRVQLCYCDFAKSLALSLGFCTTFSNTGDSICNIYQEVHMIPAMGLDHVVNVIYSFHCAPKDLFIPNYVLMIPKGVLHG